MNDRPRYRLLRHLATDHGSVRRRFPAAVLARIEAAAASAS